MGWLTVLLGVGVLLAWSVSEVPRRLAAYGRSLLTSDALSDIIFVGEGMNASIAVSEMPLGDRFFHTSGKVEASTVPADMRLQRMLGHLPALLHPKPRSVLIVGCGAGVTAGSFVLHPEVEKIVICEIEPLVPSVAALYFAEQNNGVIDGSSRASDLRRCRGITSSPRKTSSTSSRQTRSIPGSRDQHAVHQGVLRTVPTGT